ncbi:hypothetical protein NRF20_00290 [Streptomyces sp. R-74717]|uniref:hypothetical protein n=1 Tax=Streptomyces TaxID=1883 RepID=UPI0037B6290B
MSRLPTTVNHPGHSTSDRGSYATATASRPGATYARIVALDLVAEAEQHAQ